MNKYIFFNNNVCRINFVSFDGDKFTLDFLLYNDNKVVSLKSGAIYHKSLLKRFNSESEIKEFETDEEALLYAEVVKNE